MEESATSELTTIFQILMTAVTAIAVAYITHKQGKKSDKVLDESKTLASQIENRLQLLENGMCAKMDELEQVLAMQRSEFSKMTLLEDDKETIYSTLQRVFDMFKFSRCYILQCHPLSGAMWLSVVFERKGEGFSSVRQEIGNFPIVDIQQEYHKMVVSDFNIIEDTSEVASSKIKGVFYRIGSKTVITKKMISGNKTIGFLVGSYNTLTILDDETREKMHYAFGEAVAQIQDIIPEIK